MHAAFRKDILRTIRGNLKRFVAIVVITILGTAMFSGLKAGCDDLRAAADDFYDSQQLFDMRVLSTLGITQDDVDTLAGIEGVAHAEGGYAETAHVKVAGERASVDVKALSDSGINEPYLVEGELPDSAGEVAVTRGYLKDSGASIGDTLAIEDAADEANEVFERRDYTIVGAVIDPMEVNNAEGSMSFRAASSSDYAFFVTQDDVVADTFTVAYVRLVGADEILCYSDEYDDIVSQVTDRIDAVSDERAQARTDEVIGDALEQVEDGEREAQESFDEAERAFADGQKELDAQRATLESAQQQLVDGRAQLDASQAQINDGWAQLNAGQAQIDSGWAEIESGQAELNEGAAELEDGQRELDEQRADYEREKADALAELADARAEVESIEPATWYIQDRSSLSGYSSIESDADSIEALGTAFPIIFLIVAILVSLTAITRLVEEQRGLIGTYKSLGFAKHQVYAKYLIYALSACIIGGIIGNVFGFVLLPLFLFTVFDVMYVLPGYPIVYNVASGVLGILLFVVAIGGSAFLSCRSEIHQTPADLLRPKVPKFGSRIFLERIRFVWKRLSFLNKVTARNLFRYKKRFFMTVAGIMGCTALIVCAFVIKDSVALMAPEQYESIDRYDIMAVVDADDLEQVAEDLSADGKVASLTRALVDSGEVGNGESTVDAQIIVVPDGGELEGYIAMADASGSPFELPDEGMLVTNNASQVLGLEQGGSAVLQDSSLEQRDALVAGVSQSYLGNYAYLSEEAYEDLFGAGAYEPNAVLVQLADGVDGPAFADELSQDSTYLSVVSTRELEDSFASSFQLINTVVAVILVMAAALAFVVLFTLSTTNISERERELATIKVLGFRRREVHHYVNKETLILTGIGIVFGLIAGPPLGGVLLGSLNMPGIAFPTHIEWYSMIICAVLPFVFALIVDAITNRTLDRIDMIGALKSVE